jgi:hypothetical protein
MLFKLNILLQDGSGLKNFEESEMTMFFFNCRKSKEENKQKKKTKGDEQSGDIISISLNNFLFEEISHKFNDRNIEQVAVLRRRIMLMRLRLKILILLRLLPYYSIFKSIKVNIRIGAVYFCDFQ